MRAGRFKMTAVDEYTSATGWKTTRLMLAANNALHTNSADGMLSACPQFPAQAARRHVCACCNCVIACPTAYVQPCAKNLTRRVQSALPMVNSPMCSPRMSFGRRLRFK
ncbi:hypothetical protein EON66_03270 [archaeon]|nr:MAG: hypothetical protein EON66_03270 [archaeon]